MKTNQKEIDMSADFDPVKYGALWQKVQEMDKKFDKLEANVEELLALANKGRGGFWMGMTIASSVGAAVAWIAGHMKGG
jgi:hypothetical protein